MLIKLNKKATISGKKHPAKAVVDVEGPIAAHLIKTGYGVRYVEKSGDPASPEEESK